MDRAEKDLQRYMKRKRAERRRGRRDLIAVAVVIVLIAIVLKLIGQTRIVFFFSL